MMGLAVPVDPYAECLNCGTWHYCRFKRRCTSKGGHVWRVTTHPPQGEKK